MRPFLILTAAILLLTSMAGCPAGEGDAPGGEGADWASLIPQPGMLQNYEVSRLEGSEVLPGEVVQDETVDGLAYRAIEVGDFSSDAGERFRFLVDFSTEWELGIKRATWWQPGDDAPMEDFDLDNPIVIPVDSDASGSATHDTTGVLTTGGMDPVDIELEITRTIVENDATITVPLGEVSGCTHVRLDIGWGENGPPTFSFPVETWLHPEYGFVASDDFLGGARMELASVD